VIPIPGSPFFLPPFPTTRMGVLKLKLTFLVASQSSLIDPFLCPGRASRNHYFFTPSYWSHLGVSPHLIQSREYTRHVPGSVSPPLSVAAFRFPPISSLARIAKNSAYKKVFFFRPLSFFVCWFLRSSRASRLASITAINGFFQRS